MRHVLSTTLIAIAMLPSLYKPVPAATGVNVPGSHAVEADIAPPPGLYFQDDTYFCSGEIGGGIALPTGRLLVANVSATASISLPTTMRAPPKNTFKTTPFSTAGKSAAGLQQPVTCAPERLEMPWVHMSR